MLKASFIQRFKEFWGSPLEPEIIIPAKLTTYEIRPLTMAHLDEVFRLDQRCFARHEVYTKATLKTLLELPTGLSYRAITPENKMSGFVIATLDEDYVGHITTIGVAPEHRRRALASRLLSKAEEALRLRNINMVRLEVRASNNAAQKLYREHGYCVMQRLHRYYTNGDDGLMMLKSLI